MGQTFWRGVVASLDGIEDVDIALDTLGATGLVRRQARSRVRGDVEYAFKHVLVRDAAYEMLPRATRRTLHAAWPPRSNAAWTSRTRSLDPGVPLS